MIKYFKYRRARNIWRDERRLSRSIFTSYDWFEVDYRIVRNYLSEAS